MMFKKTIMVFGLIILVSCDKPDSVPNVDDVNNIIVDGQKMTKIQFMDKYCYAKTDNETCLKVSQAQKKGIFNATVPKGW